MKQFALRLLAAAALVFPLSVTPARSAPAEQTAPLSAAIASLRTAVEVRAGYERARFRHWNAGEHPRDGCSTRNEVLLHEAVEPPSVSAGCRLSQGQWHSYYDDVRVTSPAGLDIDHMVPLAEAWDSGAFDWTPARREAYANDQGAEASLVAVTARSNRSKADQDVAQWLPPSEAVHCRYAAEWTGTKLRWQLTADAAELQALRRLAAACSTTLVTYVPATSVMNEPGTVGGR
ncbi:HNH endonuclease family protein [Streptomyces chryseus]